MIPNIDPVQRMSVAKLLLKMQLVYSEHAFPSIFRSSMHGSSGYEAEFLEDPLFEMEEPLLLYTRTMNRLNAEMDGVYAALFFDEDGDELPLVVVPEYSSIEKSLELLLAQLARSEIAIRRISQDEADAITVERISEYLAVGRTLGKESAQYGQSTVKTMSAMTADTVVTSLNQGETILYRKGLYLSTATAFGMSTPAVNQIKPGRYSFGVEKSSGHVFSSTIWTCPRSDVELKM